MLIARLLPDEASIPQILQRLLDLRTRVHHERTIARDRLVQRPRRREEEPAAVTVRGRFDRVAVAEDDERGPLDTRLRRTETHLAAIDVRERGVSARDLFVERGTRRQRHVDELRRDREPLDGPDETATRGV